MRNRRQKAELLRRLRYTAWEAADFERCTAIVKGRCPCPEDAVECARAFLVSNAQSYNKSGRTHSISDSSPGIRKWSHISDFIDRMAARIRACRIFSLDYADLLSVAAVNDERTLAYFDPPYVDYERMFYRVNRRGGFDHAALRAHLDECRASVLMSYEDHPAIREHYREADGFTIIEHTVTRSLGNNGKQATELLIIRPSDWARQQGVGRLRPKRIRDFEDEDVC